MALELFSASRRAIEERADSFESKIDQLATIVAGRFARGNIALQAGRILTNDRLEGEREARSRKDHKR